MSPNLENLGNRTMVSTSGAAAPNISKKRADDLINWLREYAKERINSRLIDERRCVPPYIILDLGNRGILGMQIPEQYGGLALKNRDFMRVMEQLAAIDLTLAISVSLNNTLGIRPIMGYATQEMRDELLPILARGRELAAFGMTEPGAGADIGTISTLAVADAKGGWRLRGMKRWNGFAWAGVINVFVRLVDDTNSKQSGLTGFVVRQGTPGLRIGPESLTMGLRGIVQNALYFEDVPVGLSNILGELGNGTAPADDAVLFARLGIGIISVGGMKRCAQLILRYATCRSIATGRLLDSPITLARLSNLTAAITALEALLELIAGILDEGYIIPREIAVITKIAASEYVWQAADDLVQLLGGRGYMENNIASQILRDARVLRLGEGPNESLRIFLGKSVIHTENLNQFLRDRLGAASVSDKLSEAAERIKARCLRPDAPFSEPASAMAWAYSLTGEVAIYALLLVAVQQAANLNSSEQLHQAVEWVQFHFEQSLEKALVGTLTESILPSAKAITDVISGYAKSIDDIEQSLAGEDHELDELLQKNRSNKDSDLKSNIALEIPAKSETLKPVATNKAEKPVAPEKAEALHRVPIQTPESIQDWIVDWLVRKLKIEAKSIDPSKAFADFGMDSVFAVELAQDLADWLNHSLDATILWNFPTIESLARHLASELSTSVSISTDSNQQPFSRTQQTLSQNGQDRSNSAEISTAIEVLSDNEIAKLLAEEIAKSAQRK